ncbi:MAG: HAMP domain-containing protein [Chloroflexi bacterium]|nr:HAMP domain-containing protein [Chloroflexota bacterium]
MPIRWRLTIWFVLVLSGILVLSGVLTHNLLRNYLSSEIDDNLSIYTARVHGTLHADEVPVPPDYNVIHSRLPLVSEFASPGVYIQLVDKDGTVVVKSDNLGNQQLPISPVLVQNALKGSVELGTLSAGDGARVRVIVSPLLLQDRTLVLEVGQSLHSIELVMNRMRLSLVGGVLAAIILAGVLGYTIVRKTLSPVKQITKTARAIEESSDLGRKVNYHGPRDEVEELAATFDRMIGRLNVAFESQRQFVADASHELRTPLTVIKGNLALLKRDLSDEDRRESLQAMRSETERMARIVDDLLILAEVEGGQVSRDEKVSLDEVLLDGLTRAQQLAGDRNVVLGRHEDLFVRGDAYRLKQMVGNLVDNAVKYTPDGGSIALSLVREGGFARIDVADTGPGIGPEHVPHIFERFYRVDKARSRAEGGTGLGLAIVKQIAESHGGSVAVSSKPGSGSTFSVWLKL